MAKSNIAGAINDAHRKVEAAKVEGARYAIECGRLLIDAKATVPHGGWDAWLKAHCEVAPRTAQLYMRIAKHVGGDPSKAQRVADLSLREAAAQLAKPRLSIAAKAAAYQLLAQWYSVTPTVRQGFADRLLAGGEITKAQHRQMLAAATGGANKQARQGKSTA